MPVLQSLVPGVWLMRFPLRLMGMPFGRNVTLLELPENGGLVIHSTAPFAPGDVEAISGLGKPLALVDATCFHDTFAAVGRSAFPEVPYFTPSNFPAKLAGRPIAEGQAIWGEALTWIALGGMPKIQEHVCFHQASGTLVVADLFFNLRGMSGFPAKLFGLLTGVKTWPGMSRLFRFSIRDRSAFLESLAEIQALPIKRIVCGHGEVITDAPQQTLETIAAKLR